MLVLDGFDGTCGLSLYPPFAHTWFVPSLPRRPRQATSQDRYDCCEAARRSFRPFHPELTSEGAFTLEGPGSAKARKKPST